jgi:hypothetical protein
MLLEELDVSRRMDSISSLFLQGKGCLSSGQVLIFWLSHITLDWGREKLMFIVTSQAQIHCVISAKSLYISGRIDQEPLVVMSFEFSSCDIG